jgi:hypothetical protein
VTELLSPVELECGWVDVSAHAERRHVQPFSHARQRFVREAQSLHTVTVGVPQIDYEMRGLGPGELAIVNGFTHNGKTQFTVNVVHQNHEAHILWFTPDETESLVFIKLASLVGGTPARELEARVRTGDPTALRLLDQVVEEFPNLVIIHAPLTQRLLREATDEAHDLWGERSDLVIIDYLDLMRGADLASKADAIKAFGIENEVPLWVLHQVSRSAGRHGQRLGIDAGNFGGETWATFVLGVWRRKHELAYQLWELERKDYLKPWEQDRVADLRWQLAKHEYTVTVNLSKNKRPGGRTLEDGIDFELFGDTGEMRLLNGDLPQQYRIAGGGTSRPFDPRSTVGERWPITAPTGTEGGW